MTIQDRRGKAPPLPPDTRNRLRPYRHRPDRDDAFDEHGMRPTAVRFQRDEVVSTEVEEPGSETRDEKGGVKTVKHKVRAHRVQSRLEWLHRRKAITEAEMKAGERYAMDYEISGGSAKSCLDFSTGGGDVESAILYASPGMAANRVAGAREAMGLALWPLVQWVAVDGREPNLWVMERKIKARSGTGVAMLKLALQHLHKHYNGEE